MKYFIYYTIFILSIHNYNRMEEEYILSCSNGDIKQLKNILNNINAYKFDIHFDIHIDNEKALKIACENNRLNIIKYLIEFGELNNNKFDIHSNDDELIKIACKYNYCDIIKYLVEYSNKYNTPFNLHDLSNDILRSTCENDNIEILKYLIEHIETETNFNYVDMYYYIFGFATVFGSLKIIKYILYNNYPLNVNDNTTAQLIFTCRHNNIDVIKFLLKYYMKKKTTIDIKTIIEYIFEGAYRFGFPNITKFIINYSNKSHDKFNIQSHKFTDLFCSTNMKFIKFLISYLCTQSDSSIQLHLKQIIPHLLNNACTNGQYKIVKYILKYAHNNKIPIKNANQLFIESCRSTNIKLVRMILKYKWNEPIDIHYNNNVLFEHVCRSGNFELFKFLLNNCKKNNNIFDLHYNNFILLFAALCSDNIKLIEFLLYYDTNKSNNVLHNASNNINLSRPPFIGICYTMSNITFKYFIEYCFKFNIVVDIYCNSQYIFYDALLYTNYYVMKYFIYLSKHNYNYYNKEFLIYNTAIINTINDRFYIPEIIDFLSRYPALFFTKKYIKYTFMTNCRHYYKYIINNNITCIQCNESVIFKTNYTIFYI